MAGTNDMYFGRLTSNPNNPNDRLQTDCGGLVVTQNDMTFGQARELADKINLDRLYTYLLVFKQSAHYKLDTAYFKNGKIVSPRDAKELVWHYDDQYVEDNLFRGVLYVAIYRFLCDVEAIKEKNERPSYCNSLESMYQMIIDRLVSAGKIKKKSETRYSLV